MYNLNTSGVPSVFGLLPRQVTTLERSCALMDKTMDLLKGHIKKLEEVGFRGLVHPAPPRAAETVNSFL